MPDPVIKILRAAYAAAFLCALLFCAQDAEARAKGRSRQQAKKTVQPAAKTKRATRKKAPVQKQIVRKRKIARQNQAPKISATPEIRERQQELQRLQNEISETRRKISRLSSTENSTLKNLKYSQKHSADLSRHIELLEGELSSLQSSISQAQEAQAQLKSRLETLQSQYGDLVRTLYRERAQSADEIMTTGNSGSGNAARRKYLAALTERLNLYSREIAKVQDSLTVQKSILEDQSHQQENILSTKSREQVELERNIAQNKKSLDDIRSNKTLLQKQLDEKERSVRAIAGMISQLVAKEIAERRAREEKIRQEKIAEQKRRAEQRRREQEELEERKRELARKEALTKKEEAEKQKIAQKQEELRQEEKTEAKRGEGLSPRPGGDPGESYERPAFTAKGLPWPLGSRKILHPFGQYKNPVSNTTLENPGIDIAAVRGSSVQAVADGIVSLVHFLPGYGSLVIINHENGFRSVYANLTGASVRSGQRVRAGGLIGRSGESVDGEFLHFELWRQKQRLNPMQWLR